MVTHVGKFDENGLFSDTKVAKGCCAYQVMLPFHVHVRVSTMHDLDPKRKLFIIGIVCFFVFGFRFWALPIQLLGSGLWPTVCENYYRVITYATDFTAT